jgi:putative transposase
VLAFIPPQIPSSSADISILRAVTGALLSDRPSSSLIVGLDTAKVVHRPRLLSDNGSSYIAGNLAEWLKGQGFDHIRGAPLHPQTQGKIERWHQTLKNRILLENYYLPGDLEARIGDFVAHYNHLRYHESITNLTPADVYFGCGQTILFERERIKRQTIQNRRLHHRGLAA